MYNFCMGSEFNYGFNENFQTPKLTFPNIVGFCLCRVLQFFPINFCTNKVNYDFFYNIFTGNGLSKYFTVHT